MPAAPADSRFASHLFAVGQVYTRAELREKVGTTDTSIDALVFRPSGYNSVWLFVTQQISPASSLPSRDLLVWPGQLAGRNDQLIITHELRGLELLVFYRESTTQYPSAGFEYLGQFEYQSHAGTRPTVFTLARSGVIPNIANIQAIQDEHAPFNPSSVRDGREWVLATIVRRRGQAAFRAKLLAAYNGTCPITGCQIEDLLEAAHIIPYKGASTDHIQNGLPLRADIHTLFDLQLLAIDSDTLSVQLSPSLSNSEYAPLAGKVIALPQQVKHCPSREALRAHRIRCPF